jgi:mycothiol synthase
VDHGRGLLARSSAVDERTLTIENATEVAALVEACDLAVLGRSDYTMTEIETDLRSADLEHLGWYDGTGALVAYGWLEQMPDSNKIRFDAYVHPSADKSLGVDLLSRLERRGLEIVAAAGYDDAVFDTGIYRQDQRTRGWLQDRRFTIGTTFTRMRIDLQTPVELSDADLAIAVRESDKSEEELRTAHAIDEASFTEHYGHVPRTFEAFRAWLERNGPQWSRVWLGELDGKPAGLLVATPQFVEDENAGYVRSLGVLPAGRGRGVARALLRTYFAIAQDEGRAAVLLHVDVANKTNALALYESVGMRPVLEIDSWAKRSHVIASGEPAHHRQP